MFALCQLSLQSYFFEVGALRANTTAVGACVGVMVGPGAQGEGSTAYYMGGNSLAYSYVTTHAADPNL